MSLLFHDFPVSSTFATNSLSSSEFCSSLPLIVILSLSLTSFPISSPSSSPFPFPSSSSPSLSPPSSTLSPSPSLVAQTSRDITNVSKTVSVLSYTFPGCHIHRKPRDFNTYVKATCAKCGVFQPKVLTSIVSHAMKPTSIRPCNHRSGQLLYRLKLLLSIRTIPGLLLFYHPVRKLLAANGFIRLKFHLIYPLSDTKHNSSLKVSFKFWDSITLRPLALWSSLLQYIRIVLVLTLSHNWLIR